MTTKMTTIIEICCNVECPQRWDCQKFQRALDVNSGKIVKDYKEVKCERCNEYEK